MCDYSLGHVASRPARLGEVLVTTIFPSSWTRGFSAPGNADVAVCLRPGTELAFAEDIDWERPFRFFWRPRPIGNLARFRQVNVDDPHVHHDAIEFPDGRLVMVTRLRPGQRATVVQLPVERSLAAVPTRDRAAGEELVPAKPHVL